MRQREREKSIFETLLKVAPMFLGDYVQNWSQPPIENDFPDVICSTALLPRIGVELGEWLNEAEMTDAKGLERIQDSIWEAIEPQGDNETENIHYIWLFPKKRPRIRPSDRKSFRKELFRYIAEVDGKWSSEKFWQTPQGYQSLNEELRSYPCLIRYLDNIHFHPRMHWNQLNGTASKRTWPRGPKWIIFPCRGGAYSKHTMLLPLQDLLAEKLRHYGGVGTGFDRLCLVIYYNEAWLYNSPVETPFFNFDGAVEAARNRLRAESGPFNDVFLLLVAGGEQRLLRIV